MFDADNQLPDGTFLSPSADYPVIRLDGKSQGQIRLALVFEEDGNDIKNIEWVLFFLDKVFLLLWWLAKSSSGTLVFWTNFDLGAASACAGIESVAMSLCFGCVRKGEMKNIVVFRWRGEYRQG